MKVNEPFASKSWNFAFNGHMIIKATSNHRDIQLDDMILAQAGTDGNAWLLMGKNCGKSQHLHADLTCIGYDDKKKPYYIGFSSINSKNSFALTVVDKEVF
ncbi:hypothetical protein [Enterobacter kobei]|uniref:hypothetical protein n=1 Tax=Enterobacter kobei TaxID=208224 RepID=UPI003CE70BCF